MKISLIIPSYRRFETLKRTLETIEYANSKPNEILIIDQTERDFGADKIAKLCDSYSLVRYIRSETPGSTKARNIGFENALYDVVVFMDDDVDVKVDTFESIQKLMEDDKISLIGGIDELSYNRSSLSSKIFGKARFYNTNQGYVTRAVYGCFPDALPNKRVLTDWAMGFFFVIRKSLANKWNIKFDEKLKYYAYAEDLDYTLSYARMSKSNNLECIMSPEVIVRHNVSKEYRQTALKSYIMIYSHRLYLSRKHFGNSLVSLLALKWSNFGDIIMAYRKKQNVSVILRAQRFVKKYKNDIIAGNFHYNEFM